MIEKEKCPNDLECLKRTYRCDNCGKKVVVHESTSCPHGLKSFTVREAMNPVKDWLWLRADIIVCDECKFSSP